MKKFILILLVISAAFSSCSKTDNTPTFDAAAQAVADDATIKAYLAAHTSITATKDPSGVYYQIITQGTGANATSTSTISANYNGSLLDGTVFDKTTTNSLSFSLSQVIKGWQIGIPLVKAGGRILLIIPSGLAYGNSSPSSLIPVNSVLLFTIDVLTVK